MPCCLDGALRFGKNLRGVRVQAARPRRGPDRGRDRPLARRGGPGDRRGRPARRGADRQDDGRDPLAGGGKVARILVAEGDVVPVGTVLVVIGEDGTAPAAEEQQRGEPAASVPATAQGQSARAVASRDVSGRRRSFAAWPQELGVDLSSVAGTGPGGRDHGGRRPRAAPGTVPGQGQEGRREPLRGVRRLDRRAHGARAPRGAAGDLGRGVRLHGRRAQAARPDRRSRRSPRACGVPRAERAARGRRDRLPRPLRPRRRRPDRPGPRRPGRPRLRPRSRRRARRRGRAPRRGRARRDAQARGAARLDLHGHERGQARWPASRPRSSTTPRWRSSVSGASPSAQSSATARSQARRTGTIAITFDHRVVDGARAAEFGLAVIERLQA